jgi:hypothetical protein
MMADVLARGTVTAAKAFRAAEGTGPPASAPMSRELEAVLPSVLRDNRLSTLDAFPAHEKARAFLTGVIDGIEAKRIADIGGGANPMIDLDYVTRRNLRYDVLDICAGELAKAPAGYSKIVVDLCAQTDAFRGKVEGGFYDLVFTHMFLEHIRYPAAVHRNIHWMLRRGGLAIHMFPGSANLPLTVNRLLPDNLTRHILSFADPNRDVNGKQAKFPAYYKLCGAPSASIRSAFHEFGFKVLLHKGFVGHDYYARFPILRDLELRMRRPFAALGIAAVSGVLLIAQRH